MVGGFTLPHDLVPLLKEAVLLIRRFRRLANQGQKRGGHGALGAQRLAVGGAFLLGIAVKLQGLGNGRLFHWRTARKQQKESNIGGLTFGQFVCYIKPINIGSFR